METREEVEKLKKAWKYDPHWDLSRTVGFEEYEEELLAFEEECKAEWDKRRGEEVEADKKEAEKLGCSYEVYLLIEQIQIMQERHERAIEYLAEGETMLAYKALKGLED